MKMNRTKLLLLVVAVSLLSPLLFFMSEIIRCRSAAFAVDISTSDLSDIKRLETVFGPPHRRWTTTASGIGGKVVLGVPIPSSITGGERLVVSVWERRCFVVGYERFVAVSRQNGGVLVVDGISRFVYPPLIVKRDPHR